MTAPFADGPAMLDWLRTRRSVRNFAADPVDRAVLERLIEAARTAPSSSNRQPWRFAVVTSASARQAIIEAIRIRVAEIETVIRRGHHADDYGNYGDFFFEPLANAPVIVVPQFRDYPDLIGNLIESGGGDRSQFSTAAAMHAERCSTSAAVMALLLQAHAEGLGACWMAGPMVARHDIERQLRIARPFQMVGAIAVGHLQQAPAAPPRKSVEQIAQWFQD